MPIVGNVIKMPGAREAPRSIRSKMDTLELTINAIDRWKKPVFQREQRMTKKVMELVKELRDNDGVIPGVLTLGVVDGETYLVDGQHRIAAFREADLAVGYADVRICEFESMGEMGEEFVKLNSALVRMKNEDILRGMEGINPFLPAIRRRCPFIGYDRVRSAGSTRSRPNVAQTTLSVAVAIQGVVRFGAHAHGGTVVPRGGQNARRRLREGDD